MAGGAPQERSPFAAIRIGQPRAPLSDLYYRLLEGSWWRLVVAFFGFYLLANAGFGALYMLDTRGVSDVDGTFIDSFFFSVQTISTIGYGSMSPKSGFAHMLVTMEAMLGLLGFAVATGIIFAKFSRPSARVMFSDDMIVTTRNGAPCLMFRVANSRGNEIVEAAVHVTVLRDEETEEGDRIRRLHDLKLVRTNTPVFVFTWLVMHDIDTESPVADLDVETLAAEDALFIVTLTGIDATFAQTIHARHLYRAEHVKFGRRFVDMVERLPDRTIKLDFTKFHETRSDSAPG